MPEQGSKSTGKSASRRAPRLGRGLSALVGPAAPVRVDSKEAESHLDTEQNNNIISHDSSLEAKSGHRLITAPVGSVRPNPHQPRRVFDEPALQSLADSIKADGLMQPIVVRRVSEDAGGGYELVAGERRLRASKLAGLAEIPAIVREVDERTSAELALIENLQRADLNAVERAQAFRSLIDRHGLTQAELGQRMGLDRSSITNHLRLLDLDEGVLAMIAGGRLGFAHGRALAGLPGGAEQAGLASLAADKGWSARKLEQEVATLASQGGTTQGGARAGDEGDAGADADTEDGPSRARAVLDDMEKRLGEHLGTRVSLKTDRSGQRGSVTISFFSLDEFDGILGRLGWHSGGE